jgi:N-acyl homoserine lactone hydrolase
MGRSLWVGAASSILGVFTIFVSASAALAATEPAASGIERMYVFDCGDIHLDDASSFTPGATGPGLLIVSCYLIKHGEDWALFDTGVGDHIAALPEGQRSNAGYWTLKKTLVSQLAELDLTPADINYVILSHSHGDHVGNLGLFTQGTLVVQKAEWEWTPPNRTSPFHAGMKAITPDGDYDLFGDGSVMLIATHGHSPGHQNLLVRLPRSGAIMLSGDSVHTKANWDGNRAPERNFDVPQSVEALARMREVLQENNGQLWIGHEPSEAPLRRYAPQYYD